MERLSDQDLLEVSDIQCSDTLEGVSHPRYLGTDGRTTETIGHALLSRTYAHSQKAIYFIDRQWTHARLLGIANALATRVAPDTPRHLSFSTFCRLRRRKLLAHILRAPDTNICRLACSSHPGQYRPQRNKQKKKE